MANNATNYKNHDIQAWVVENEEEEGLYISKSCSRFSSPASWSSANQEQHTRPELVKNVNFTDFRLLQHDIRLDYIPCHNTERN